MPFAEQIKKKKKERLDAIEEGRSILSRVETEDRAINTEERASLTKINEKVVRIEEDLAQFERFGAGEDADAEARSGRPGLEARGGNLDTRKHATKEYRTAYTNFPATGEKRDMVLSNQAAGGYLVAPVQTSADVIKQVDNLVFMKAKARTYNVDSAQAIGVRQMTARVSDAAWTTEVGQLQPDTQLAFNRRDLTPTLLAKLVTASFRLFETGVDIEAIVNEELAYKFATTLENALLNGSGSGQPLGIFTASPNGITTGQDITSGTAGTVTADDFIKMRYAMKQPYLKGPGAAWMISRPLMQLARMLKDSYGQYIWRPGLAETAPDTLLDIPYAISEYVPSTIATGNYVACLGNFNYYAVAQVRDLAIQRLNERYADQNEIGFIGRAWFDGAPVLAEAFTRLKVQ